MVPSDTSNLSAQINAGYTSQIFDSDVQRAVHTVMELLDQGQLRVITWPINGKPVVHSWIKQAITLYLQHQPCTLYQLPPFAFYDKVPLKQDFATQQVRVVPPGCVRFGAYLAPGCIVMPSFVNCGAFIGAKTMIDTWATVGSCAQIGAEVHLSGGVGIGGVLEPPQSQPVIIEDGVFVGSRAVVVEGVWVESEAVLAAGLILTASTPIIDVTTAPATTYRGRVPARSVVIPGSRLKDFPAGSYQVPCALIIGQRHQGTDRKTSLNHALRAFAVAV